MAVKLTCGPDDWHHLISAVGNARDGSTTVRVNKEALNKLLNDHQHLVHLHNNEVEESQA